MNRYDILNRMLDRLPDNYDKSEGNPITDLLMAVAIELEAKYIDQEGILDKGFAETAFEEWLDKIVYEVGLSRKQATYSNGIVKISGDIGNKIDIGMLVSSDAISFKVTESNTIGPNGLAYVKVECVESGTIGNVLRKTINKFPIPIAGIRSVSNEEDFINGYDEESDEELRDRYYTKVRTPATSGNIYHYMNWSKEVVGVGDAKILPLWNGNGTVKVVIIDSNKQAASKELIDSTFNHIEENRPIGATVTVISATALQININATILIDNQNYSLSDIKNSFESIMDDYLGDIAFKQNYVSYAKIGSLLLTTPGVVDYSDLTVNNGIGNISIGNEEVAVVGQVMLSE